MPLYTFEHDAFPRKNVLVPPPKVRLIMWWCEVGSLLYLIGSKQASKCVHVTNTNLIVSN